MNLAFLAPLLSGITGGKVSVQIFNFILGLIPAVVELVKNFRDMQDESVRGSEKAKAVVETVAEMIDDDFDEVIPEWSELSEEKRDRMLYGLVEWVYWSIELSEKHGKHGSRKLFKRALLKVKSRT